MGSSGFTARRWEERASWDKWTIQLCPWEAKHRRSDRLTRIAQITGGPKQRGIISYGLSANRQNPLAGAGHAAIFNTWRRFRNQVLYWAPPMVFFYFAMEWAVER